MNLKLNPPLLILGALMVLPLMLSACGTTSSTEGAVVTSSAPPPLAEPEVAPVIEDPQTSVWRPGYWSMDGKTFVWVSGKVIPRPGPTAVWARARWVQHNFGWTFEEGHWE